MTKSKKIILLDLDDTLFNTDKFKSSDLTAYELYDEVNEALTKLATVATLGIFSQGEIAFQHNKLQKTNIKKFFNEEHIHIVEYKLGVIHDFLERYAKSGTIYFIDDRLPNLHMAKESEPSIVTIWMRRGRYAKTQEKITDFTPDYVIQNLQEALPVINRG